MAKEKTEGARVRAAYDGPKIDHDKLIGFVSARNDEDRIRASSAGESRQKIAAFLEETELHQKALATVRAILKLPTQEKQMDFIRSLKVALPMVEAHVAGQGTAEMPLDDEPVPFDGKAA